MRFFFTKSQFPHYLLPILSFVPVFVQSVKKNRTFCLLYINVYSKMLHKCEFCSTFVLCMHFAGTYY